MLRSQALSDSGADGGHSACADAHDPPRSTIRSRLFGRRVARHSTRRRGSGRGMTLGAALPAFALTFPTVRSSDVLSLAAVVVLTAVAGFLATAETSLTRTSRIRARHLMDEGRRGGRALVALTENPARFLNLVLLLELIVQFSATSLFTAVVEHYLPGGVGVAVAVAAMTLLTFTFAEVAPKTYAVQHTDRAALAIAPPVYLLARLPILGPLTRLLIGLGNLVAPGKGLATGPFVSEEELRALVDEAQKDEVIEQGEREMLHSVFEFGDTVVREVMVPRPDIVSVDGEKTLQEVLEVILRTGYSRIPVHSGDLDDVLGLVYAKDLLRALHDGQDRSAVATILRPAHGVPESMRAAEVLRGMQKRKSHMAIVVDEYGGTAGLVTIEDLLEEIVGEIVDEYDREEPNVEALPDGAYRVKARVAIDEVNELLGVELPSTEWDSIGGLLFNLVGEVPYEGQEAAFRGLLLRAEGVQGRRVSKILIRRSPASADGALTDGVRP